MFKFLLITFLVIWLSIKLAGFVVRLFLRSSGFTVNQNGPQPRSAPFQGRPDKAAASKPDPTRHVTDNLGGDYVDYEEVK